MTPDYEPFRLAAGGDPYPLYTALREHAPLHWAAQAQAWCVSRHADVQAVLRSAEDFSSDAMRTMLVGGRPGEDPASDPAALQRLLAFAQGRIPAGASVVVLLGSADRDPRQWGPTADAFRVDRNPQGHLAFGFGNHFCLGASLARLEARVALEALLDVLPALRRREPRVDYVDSYLVRGPRRLPLQRAA